MLLLHGGKELGGQPALEGRAEGEAATQGVGRWSDCGWGEPRAPEGPAFLCEPLHFRQRKCQPHPSEGVPGQECWLGKDWGFLAAPPTPTHRPRPPETDGADCQGEERGLEQGVEVPRTGKYLLNRTKVSVPFLRLC